MKPWSVFPRSRTRSPWRYQVTGALNPSRRQVKYVDDANVMVWVCVQLMRTSFMKHELVELPFVEHSQCECR